MTVYCVLVSTVYVYVLCHCICCARAGQALYPLGSPDGEISVFLPYTPRRPYLNDTAKLSLCLDYPLLPPLPFNHSFIKAPLVAIAQAEPDDMEVLKSTREQAHIQGHDPMSRQFAEVLINIGVDQVSPSSSPTPALLLKKPCLAF